MFNDIFHAKSVGLIFLSFLYEIAVVDQLGFEMEVLNTIM